MGFLYVRNYHVVSCIHQPSSLYTYPAWMHTLYVVLRWHVVCNAHARSLYIVHHPARLALPRPTTTTPSSLAPIARTCARPPAYIQARACAHVCARVCASLACACAPAVWWLFVLSVRYFDPPSLSFCECIYIIDRQFKTNQFQRSSNMFNSNNKNQKINKNSRNPN